MKLETKRFERYYLLSCIGVLLASWYPLSMGVRVVGDMLADGVVMKENYPKYVIPYTPIAVAVFLGVLLMPLCLKRLKRFALPGGAVTAAGVFFALELLLEQKVVVTAAGAVAKLEDWQMFMCYIPPEVLDEGFAAAYKTQTAVEILMGDYNPAFKLHFYVISVVLILSLLNGFYGFGQMIRTGRTKRRRALTVQSVCALAFLGLCILACFTAFWRDGSIRVSPLSAALMTAFFLLLGVTAGIFAGSFLLGKRTLISVGVPAAVSAAMTLLMYLGEMFLLNGYLYRFGKGFLFDGIPGLVFSPADLVVIAASGGITACISAWLNRERLKGNDSFA